jgi:hypothetical protein
VEGIGGGGGRRRLKQGVGELGESRKMSSRTCRLRKASSADSCPAAIKMLSDGKLCMMLRTSCKVCSHVNFGI